jgi:hypothetical protein
MCALPVYFVAVPASPKFSLGPRHGCRDDIFDFTFVRKLERTVAYRTSGVLGLDLDFPPAAFRDLNKLPDDIAALDVGALDACSLGAAVQDQVARQQQPSLEFGPLKQDIVLLVRGYNEIAHVSDIVTS